MAGSRGCVRALVAVGIGVTAAVAVATAGLAAPPNPPPPRPVLTGQTRGIDHQVLFAIHRQAGLATFDAAVREGWWRGNLLAQAQGLYLEMLPAATLTYPDIQFGQPVEVYQFRRGCLAAEANPAARCRNLLLATYGGVVGWDREGWLFEVFDPRATADAILSTLPPGNAIQPSPLVLPVQQQMRDKVLNQLFRTELFDSLSCPALDQDFPTAAIVSFQPVPMDAGEQARLRLPSQPEPPGPVGYTGVKLVVEGYANGTFDLARLEIAGALHRTEGPVWEARQLVERIHDTCEPVASVGRPPPQPAAP